MNPNRTRILDSVREALRERAKRPHPGRLEERAAGDRPPSPDELRHEFAEAFRRVDGEVVEIAMGGARRWLDAFVAGHATVACAPDVPGHLRPDLPEVSPGEASLGVGMALAAAADTGTFVLSSTGGRAAHLLPPAHLVWVEPGRVVATLAEALALAGAPEDGFARAGASALALHTGPSRSADIGQITVRGVHGPGRVVVALLLDGG